MRTAPGGNMPPTVETCAAGGFAGSTDPDR